MSDTKLRPEDLTSEERAIVDNAALFYRRVTGAVGETAEWAYVEALKEAEPIILARRALFAPALEKVAKVETMADRIAADLKAGTFRGEQPAPPEPAAREMPEAVRDAVDTLRSGVPSYPTWRQYADALESWWRNLAQPVASSDAVAELVNVTERTINTLDRTWDQFFAPVRGAITTVRQQAARPVAVGMTEELADLLDSIMAFADADPDTPVKQIWRKKVSAVREQAAQPVAVGMTEELEHVLSIAERDLRYKEECFDDSARTVPDERIERLRAAIAAVREQAGNGRKVECPNCGKGVAYEHLHRDSWMDRAGYVQARYVCKRPQPAPPEPAAREMPEAVRDALSFIRSIDRNWNKTSDQIADALEREWRNLAQPAAVGMTPDVEKILQAYDAANDLLARYLPPDSGISDREVVNGMLGIFDNKTQIDAREAIRQQAAQGRKVECPNCGKGVAYEHLHRDSWMDRAGYVQARYVCKRPQPAPPEPAAREMPEAVRDAVDTLRSGVPSYPTWRQYADTLESWWRNLAQPVAVGMTPELEFILDECTALSVDKQRVLSGLAARRLAECAAAVRQQVAQGRQKWEKVPVESIRMAMSGIATPGDRMAIRRYLDLLAAEPQGEEGGR